MESAFQWLNGHIIDENRVTFHVGKIHMGVGHVQGGVAMACVEIATCSVLNKYFDDNNYNLIVKTINIQTSFLRETMPGDLLVNIYYIPAKISNRESQIINITAELMSNNANNQGNILYLKSKITLLLNSPAPDMFSNTIPLFNNTLPSILTHIPNDIISNLQDNLGPAHRFYNKQVLQSDENHFLTSFTVRDELCDTINKQLSIGFGCAFLETSLGWAVPAIDKNRRFALVADLTVQVVHNFVWPSSGETVYVNCTPTKIGGSTAFTTGVLFMVDDDDETSIVILAEATAVCIIPRKKLNNKIVPHHPQSATADTSKL